MNMELVIYKKGSRGEVVGVYKSVKELVTLEKTLNPRFSPTNIYSCLSGHKKSFFSLYHQCKAVPKMRDT